jgi:hypothetical protein
VQILRHGRARIVGWFSREKDHGHDVRRRARRRAGSELLAQVARDQHPADARRELALPYVLLTSIAGSGFLDQYAWAYGSGGIAPSYSPNFSVFLSMPSDNALVTILVSLGSSRAASGSRTWSSSTPRA